MIQSQIERRPALVGQRALVDPGFVVPAESYFPAMVPGKPTAMIVSLIHCYAINPGLQAALSFEKADLSKYLKKNLLGDIGGIRRIAHQTIYEVVNRLLKTADQRFVCFIRSGPQRC